MPEATGVKTPAAKLPDVVLPDVIVTFHGSSSQVPARASPANALTWAEETSRALPLEVSTNPPSPPELPPVALRLP